MACSQPNTLSTPGSLDILCGRGRGYFEHPGNRRMLNIIQQYKGEYQKASKAAKSAITEHVLALLLESNAHFLKKASSSKDAPWCILSYKEAHKKVAHTLREQKRIIKTSTVAVKRKRVDTFDPLPLHTNLEPFAIDIAQPQRMTSSSRQGSVTISDDDESSNSGSSHSESSDDESLILKEDPLSIGFEPSFTTSEIELMFRTISKEDTRDLLDSFNIDLNL